MRTRVNRLAALEAAMMPKRRDPNRPINFIDCDLVLNCTADAGTPETDLIYYVQKKRLTQGGPEEGEEITHAEYKKLKEKFRIFAVILWRPIDPGESVA